MAIPKCDLGDIVRVFGVFVNSAGVPTNPDSLWLMLSEPQSADPASHSVTSLDVFTAANSVINDVTGSYFRDIVCDIPGVYSFRWVARGAVADAETGQFIIEEHPA